MRVLLDQTRSPADTRRSLGSCPEHSGKRWRTSLARPGSIRQPGYCSPAEIRHVVWGPESTRKSLIRTRVEMVTRIGVELLSFE